MRESWIGNKQYCMNDLQFCVETDVDVRDKSNYINPTPSLRFLACYCVILMWNVGTVGRPGGVD